MKRIISTAVLAIFVAATGATMTACDDDDVAAGVVGAVVGAGIATVIYDNNRCDSGYRTVCSNYYDYYGNLRRECRQVYHQCRYDRLNVPATESALALAAGEERIQVRQHAAANGLTVEAFAKEYWMSFEKAELYWTALDAADQGNAAPLRALGLSSEDIQLIGHMQLPTQAGIDALAKSLDQRADMTTAMINRVRAWSMSEKNRICSKPTFSMSGDEKKLCNVQND
ncbi:MAG: hypothetical protein IOD12_02820 [Silvanigrellales bacterium]|nr:hypothetical protein [Silvanigrellales bacterium]